MNLSSAIDHAIQAHAKSHLPYFIYRSPRGFEYCTETAYHAGRSQCANFTYIVAFLSAAGDVETFEGKATSIFIHSQGDPMATIETGFEYGQALEFAKMARKQASQPMYVFRTPDGGFNFCSEYAYKYGICQDVKPEAVVAFVSNTDEVTEYQD